MPYQVAPLPFDDLIRRPAHALIDPRLGVIVQRPADLAGEVLDGDAADVGDRPAEHLGIAVFTKHVGVHRLG
jgi:hypothetical protein